LTDEAIAARVVELLEGPHGGPADLALGVLERALQGGFHLRERGCPGRATAIAD